MSKKIKILIFSASPKDQAKLEVDKEFRAIFESVNAKYFSVLSVSGTKTSDFQRALVEHKPEIVHFSGHASPDEIFFESAENKSKGVQKNALTSWFSNLTEKPRIIFLNACWTADNIKSLSQIIDFVVATRQEVFDIVAIRFAAKFYECLSRGETTEAAFNLAKSDFEMEDLKDAAEMYELFIREGSDESVVFISGSNKNDKSRKKRKGGFTINIKGDVTGEKVNLGKNINQTIHE